MTKQTATDSDLKEIQLMVRAQYSKVEAMQVNATTVRDWVAQDKAIRELEDLIEYQHEMIESLDALGDYWEV